VGAGGEEKTYTDLAGYKLKVGYKNPGLRKGGEATGNFAQELPCLGGSRPGEQKLVRPTSPTDTLTRGWTRRGLGMLGLPTEGFPGRAGAV
jgi:hypothetical protein